MNLLELIELRAKNWHVTDGLNTYYKHKVSDVQVNKSAASACLESISNAYILSPFISVCVCEQPEQNIVTASPVLQDISMLDTSPSSTMATTTPPNALNPGEIIRTSGKFGKPTKIPGKNYSKDEVVIRNADSGKGEHTYVCFWSKNNCNEF